MPSILKYTVQLLNFPGAPGVNTLYFTTDVVVDPQPVADLLEDAYGSVGTFLWGSSQARLAPEVLAYDVATGDLQDVHAVDPWTVTHTGPGSPGTTATQAKLRFVTDATVPSHDPARGPRLLKGGIYLGPITDTAMTQGGTLTTNFMNAATAMFNGVMDVAGVRLVVWHRPQNRSGGAFGHVQAVGIKPVPAILRSRRD